MPAQMVLYKGRDEIIAVIIARLDPQCERNAGPLAGLRKQMGLELAIEEIVRPALVDKEFVEAGDLSAPRYPASAFSPQGQRKGDAIGAKAETER
jgi:hypothetical protein